MTSEFTQKFLSSRETPSRTRRTSTVERRAIWQRIVQNPSDPCVPNNRDLDPAVKLDVAFLYVAFLLIEDIEETAAHWTRQRAFEVNDR